MSAPCRGAGRDEHTTGRKGSRTFDKFIRLVVEKSSGEIERREVELDPQESPGEIKNREWSWVHKVGLLLLQLFLNSCALDIVLVTAPHSS